MLAVDSDEELYNIKFYGPRVTKLEATVGGDVSQDFKLTATRVAIGTESIDIAKQWADQYERAYDRGCYDP